MNSLIKKGILVILILFFVTSAFSGCGANDAKTLSAPIRTSAVQVAHSGGIQLLTSDSTVPETTEPEATAPEATAPEATAPETNPGEGDLLQGILDKLGGISEWFKKTFAWFPEFFEWFRLRVNYVFDVLIKEA